MLSRFNIKLNSFLFLFLLLGSLVTSVAPSLADDAAPNKTNNANTENQVNIPSPPDLDKTDQARSAIIVDTSLIPTVTPPVKLVSSYPDALTSLWLPIREARLTFDKPVRPVDVKLEILNNATGSIQPVVARSSVDPDLKTIRFGVSGVQTGSWTMRWTAGKSSGTLNFKMTTTPKAMGGQNHRSHGAGTLATDKVGKVALGIIPLMFFAMLVKRRRVTTAFATAVTLTGSVLALYASYLALDFTSTKSFYVSLSSAAPWSWLTISILEVLLLLEFNKKVPRNIILGLLLLVISTTPHEQTLAKLVVTYSVYFILLINIFAAVYVTTLKQLKYKLLIKIGLIVSIFVNTIFNVYSVNGFSTAYGDYSEILKSNLKFSILALASYIIFDHELYIKISTLIRKLGTSPVYRSFKEIKKEEGSSKNPLTRFLDNSDVAIEIISKNVFTYIKSSLLRHLGLILFSTLAIVVGLTLFLALSQLVQFAPVSAGL